jgi:hypothetical protein
VILPEQSKAPGSGPGKKKAAGWRAKTWKVRGVSFCSDDVRQHQQHDDHQRHPEQPQNNRHISLQALI